MAADLVKRLSISQYVEGGRVHKVRAELMDGDTPFMAVSGDGSSTLLELLQGCGAWTIVGSWSPGSDEALEMVPADGSLVSVGLFIKVAHLDES